MRALETGLPGVLVIEPSVFGDERGWFMENWRASAGASLGLPRAFVQSNVSKSGPGVLRGLHHQFPRPQGKLVSVLAGAAFDVAVDIRTDSPTYRQWVGVELSAGNHRQLWVPEGFAHGFCTLGEATVLHYLCTDEYVAECDAAIAWNDPSIGIEWPIEPAALSRKDAAAPRLADIDPAKLPRLAP